MFSMEIIIIIVVAIAVGAAIAYFFLTSGSDKDDGVRTNVIVPPSYLRAEAVWQYGGDDVLAYDVANNMILTQPKSQPGAMNEAQRWMVDMDYIAGNIWQVIYNDQGGRRYYLARDNNGNAIASRVLDMSCAWSVIGPTDPASPAIMIMDPNMDPAHPQITTLTMPRGGRVQLSNFDPSVAESSQFVWRTVGWP